jgi:hypothetical protein
MKRILFFALVCAFFIHGLYAQNVDSIRVEQTGDLIKIHYKILNSNITQIFRVTVFCSINGGLESKLKSLSGDFGENVAGGRQEYMVLWDVLKDVDEIETVDFIVKAELVKGEVSPDGPKPVKISKKRFYLLAAGLVGPLNQQFGGRIGFMGDFGFSVSSLFGKKDYKEYKGEPYYEGFTTSVNLTKRIINKPDFQLHFLAGATLANHESYAEYNYQDIMCSGLDVGLIAGFKRFALYAGYSSAKKPFKSEYDSDGTTWFNFGAGIRF